MRTKTFVYLGVAHVALALLGMACSKAATSGGGSHCAALATCCASPGFPAAQMSTCTSAVTGNDDGVCEGNLSAFGSLGYCSATTGSGGAGGGGAGGGGESGHGGGGGSSSSGGSSAHGGSTASSSSNGTTSSTGTSSGGGPIIQSLTSNPSPVTPAGTTISAIVADPAGVSALTGGTLTDKVSGTTYGAFGTPGGQGTFEYALTWTALYQATAINFPAGASQQRVVTAQFFDNTGHSTSKDLTLTLQCDTTAGSPCATMCEDLMNDANNCGACGTTCATAPICQHGGSNCACHAGKCSVEVTSAEISTGSNCTVVCTDVGGKCTANTCAGIPLGAQAYGGVNVACTNTGSPFYDCCCQ